MDVPYNFISVSGKQKEGHVMASPPLYVNAQVVVEREHLQHLLAALLKRGYQVVGPTVRDNAIVYDTLASVDDLPVGYTDEQDGGSYRLKKRDDKALFGYAVGPQSWKRFLHPPVLRLWQARRIVQKTSEQMGRSLDTTEIKDLLYRNMEHPRWDEVATRCLSCTNCTMVCPTCFCTTVEDTSDLAGENAERWRKWDSCFDTSFSYISGGSIRSSVKSRYRQWMTHKLASWIDQFGTSGCVGCGRCITWCPVGIDITEEVRAIRESESTTGATGRPIAMAATVQRSSLDEDT